MFHILHEYLFCMRSSREIQKLWICQWKYLKRDISTSKCCRELTREHCSIRSCDIDIISTCRLETTDSSFPLRDLLYLIDEDRAKILGGFIQIGICPDVIPEEIFFIDIADIFLLDSLLRLQVTHQISHDRALPDSSLPDEYLYDIFAHEWSYFLYVFLSSYYSYHTWNKVINI